MTHFFHPDAAVEFEEAVNFYRARGRTLGDRFAMEVRAAIRRILEHPRQWRELAPGMHRCLVRVFPYCIIYTLESNFILIVAITHNRREPGYWRYRLRTKPHA